MEDNKSLFSLSIDPVTKNHLGDAARWAKFLAITGMVVLFLGLIFSLLGATFLSDAFNMSFTMNGEPTEEVTGAMRMTMVVTAIIFTAIVFFPLLFLLQFANNTKRALAANNQGDLNTAIQNLKKYFRYIGIIVLIVVLLYAFIILLAILGTAAA